MVVSHVNQENVIQMYNALETRLVIRSSRLVAFGADAHL